MLAASKLQEVCRHVLDLTEASRQLEAVTLQIHFYCRLGLYGLEE